MLVREFEKYILKRLRFCSVRMIAKHLLVGPMKPFLQSLRNTVELVHGNAEGLKHIRHNACPVVGSSHSDYQ